LLPTAAAAPPRRRADDRETTAELRHRSATTTGQTETRDVPSRGVKTHQDKQPQRAALATDRLLPDFVR